MHIGILGYGVVGKALANYLNTVKCDVFTFDPDPKSGASYDRLKSGMDVVYVCVNFKTIHLDPDDTTHTFDESLVWEVVDAAYEYTSVVVIKSTVPPDVISRLVQKYPDIVYEPEFLTQSNAFADMMNAKFRVVGYSGNRQDVIDLYDLVYDGQKVVYTDPVSASAMKYTVNSFLALKVAYMNELSSLFSKCGVDWNTVVDLVKLDERIGGSHLQVPGPDGQYGFGGACFPKDTETLLELSYKVGCSTPILETAIRENKIRRGII